MIMSISVCAIRHGAQTPRRKSTRGPQRLPNSGSKKEVPVANGPTVVIVEDEASVRGFVRCVLVNAGYRTRECQNVAQAKMTILQEEPSVSLMIADIRMPGGSGLELALEMERLRPQLPILYISGLIDSVVVQGLLLRDPNAILMKPFRAEELLSRVRLFLGKAVELPRRKPATSAQELNVGPYGVSGRLPFHCSSSLVGSAKRIR